MTSTALREPGAAGAGDWRRERCLHVIDLESLAGAAYAPASEAGRRAGAAERLLRLTWSSYQHAIGVEPGDHAMLGLRASRCGPLSDLLAGSGTQLRVGRSAAGVRTALLESVDVAHAARRFSWLLIAGAPGEFTGLAIAAREAGMRVWAVDGVKPSAPARAAARSRQCERPPHHSPHCAAA